MKRLVKGLLISALFLTVLVACQENEEDQESAKEDMIVPVEVTKAEEGDLTVEKSIYGRMAPFSSTPVMPNNPGEVDELKVQNGDKVEKDDHMATISSPAGKQNIYASKAGEIANLEVEEGSITPEGEPLAVILNMEKVKINFSVTSDVRTLFKKDEEVKAIVDSEAYKAKVKSVAVSPDDTGLYPVEATLENEDEDFIPGMVAVVKVPQKKVKDTIILPTEAIIEEREGSFVYLIKDDEAVETEVEIMETQSDKTAIKGDIKKGDQVVVNGGLTLSDGAKVEIVEEGNES